MQACDACLAALDADNAAARDEVLLLQLAALDGLMSLMPAETG